MIRQVTISLIMPLEQKCNKILSPTLGRAFKFKICYNKSGLLYLISLRFKYGVKNSNRAVNTCLGRWFWVLMVPIL